MIDIRITTALLLLTAAGLTACNSARRSVEDKVRETLLDPESARFGEFYINEKTGQGCLGVNAKNKMGGYTGEQQFILSKDEDGWNPGISMEMSHDDCKSMADSQKD